MTCAIDTIRRRIPRGEQCETGPCVCLFSQPADLRANHPIRLTSPSKTGHHKCRVRAGLSTWGGSNLSPIAVPKKLLAAVIILACMAGDLPFDGGTQPTVHAAIGGRRPLRGGSGMGGMGNLTRPGRPKSIGPAKGAGGSGGRSGGTPGAPKGAPSASGSGGSNDPIIGGAAPKRGTNMGRGQNSTPYSLKKPTGR